MYCGKRRRRRSAFKLRLAGPENSRPIGMLAGQPGTTLDPAVVRPRPMSRPMGMLAGQPGATLDSAVVRPRPTTPPYLSEGGETGSGFSGDGTYTIKKV